MSLVHLRGPRGMGKSALVELLRAEVCDEANVLITSCASGDDLAAAKSLFGAERVEALESARDRHALMRALNGMVAKQAARRPLVLVLDDAHRCDVATARWLGVLARQLPEPKVCVVLVYPCSDRIAAEAMFAGLTGALDATTIDLGPFDEADVVDLIQGDCGFVPDQQLVADCLAAGAGIPGITRSWVARLAENGTAVPADTDSVAWHLAWLGDQPEETHRYVTAVAVLGGAGSTSCAALARVSAAAAQATRKELELIGVLAPQGEFRSAELRDRLLNDLGPQTLAELRTKAGRLLTDEGRPQEEVAELVIELPALTEPWMFCTLRGAARSGVLTAQTAVEYLRRVLDAVPGHVDTTLELAAALTEVDPGAAVDAYVGVLPQITDPTTRVIAAARCGDVALRAGRGAEVFGLLAEDLSRNTPADPELYAQVETMVLVNGFSDPTTVRQAMIRARSTTAPTVSSQGCRRLVQQLARAEVLKGQSVRTALDLVHSALPLPCGPHDIWDLFPVSSMHFCGERAEAMALADQVIESASAAGHAETRSIALATRAGLWFEAGELGNAERDARAALAVPGFADGFTALTVLASVLVRRTEHDRAEQLFGRMGISQDPVEHGWATMAKARWLHGCGQLERSLEMALQCGRDYDAMGVHNPVLVPWWLDAIPGLLQMDRRAEAAELAERGGEAARYWNTPAARGYALLAEGMTTGRVEALEQAVTELGDAGARLYEAQAMRALGRALLEANDEKSARKYLRAAVDLAVRCGSTVAAERGHQLLTSAGGRMSAVTAAVKDTLTTGERRVATLAAMGMTNREIAEKLHVTVRTVESHLSNAYRKLGAQTRAELAVQLR